MGARVCRPVSSTKAVTARVRSSCVTLAFGEGSEAKATIGDDGQVAVMAAQLYAQGAIDLLGFTVLSGNQWRDQEVSDCLKAVERLGIEHRVKVHAGAQYPLLHDYNAYQLELTLFGPRKHYVGAYRRTQPEPGDLIPPPDGFATHTRPAQEDAVRFLIDTFHRYPHEVTLLAIGPLTNVALAMREDPTIVPLIKQIVMMKISKKISSGLYQSWSAKWPSPSGPKTSNFARERFWDGGMIRVRKRSG
jgi:Inosine-uridine preferring nucleoside hydrolase